MALPVSLDIPSQLFWVRACCGAHSCAEAVSDKEAEDMNLNLNTMLEYNWDRNNSMATCILHGCHCVVHQSHATLPGVRTERQDSENTSTERTGQGPSLKSRRITLTGARYCQFSLVGHSWQHRLVLTSGFLHGSTLASLIPSATRIGGWRNHRREYFCWTVKELSPLQQKFSLQKA